MRIFLLIFAIILGAFRLSGHHENLLKDVAHIYMGILIGMIILLHVIRDFCIERGNHEYLRSVLRINWALLFVMIALEIFAFHFYGNTLVLGNP